MKKVVVAAVAGALVGLGAVTLLQPPMPATAASSDTYNSLDLFGQVLEKVRGEYVEEINDQTLIESAVNGMLSSLDPHSSYLTRDAFRDMRVQTRGEFGGLGIEVTMENGYVKVVAPIDDTPAARADMQPNDLITHLDGEPVLGLTLSDAVKKMRGPVNTDLTLTVIREGLEEPFDVVLTRAVIQIKAVRHRIEGDVGYLRITTFNEHTFEDLENALKNLKSEMGDEETAGYVIDLRNNPGGLLEQAVKVSDAFLDRGEIVSTRGRGADEVDRRNATEGDLTAGKPLIVLINGGSASASEIVAGALQDHRRAIILGTKSFGKGSVQTIIPLNNGERGALRLTTSRYYTPSGRSIQAKGITPDIEVEQATLETVDERRPRLSENDLRGRLDADDGDDTPGSTSQSDDEGEREDYQLSYALDLIRGLTLIEQTRVMQ